MTLGADAYTDPAWFRAEGDRIFARMWLAVGRASAIEPPGAFITRDVAGASVIVLRGQDGVTDEMSLKLFCLMVLNLNEFMYLD